MPARGRCQHEVPAQCGKHEWRACRLVPMRSCSSAAGAPPSSRGGAHRRGLPGPLLPRADTLSPTDASGARPGGDRACVLTPNRGLQTARNQYTLCIQATVSTAYNHCTLLILCACVRHVMAASPFEDAAGYNAEQDGGCEKRKLGAPFLDSILLLSVCSSCSILHVLATRAPQQPTRTPRHRRQRQKQRECAYTDS